MNKHRLQKRKSIVINMFAGPSAGKTTLAVNLYGRMKMRRMSCGFAPEYPKEKVYRGEPLYSQLEITLEQYQRIDELYGEVDYVITDSPILLGCAYLWDQYDPRFNERQYFLWKSKFDQFLTLSFNKYVNFNIYMDRNNRAYDPEGRVQTEEESNGLDTRLKEILAEKDIMYTVKTDNSDCDQLIEEIEEVRKKAYGI